MRGGHGKRPDSLHRLRPAKRRYRAGVDLSPGKALSRLAQGRPEQPGPVQDPGLFPPTGEGGAGRVSLQGARNAGAGAPAPGGGSLARGPVGVWSPPEPGGPGHGVCRGRGARGGPGHGAPQRDGGDSEGSGLSPPRGGAGPSPPGPSRRPLSQARSRLGSGGGRGGRGLGVAGELLSPRAGRRHRGFGHEDPGHHGAPPGLR
ncbi:MAG: hypothetical protein BWY88_01329 [Synergistetes bacterium ADurb.Bin520]|nr:MAG: hypothetical protein BWY88_01329 [Synergistetes bacterium ADurb.Bin520]